MIGVVIYQNVPHDKNGVPLNPFIPLKSPILRIDDNATKQVWYKVMNYQGQDFVFLYLSQSDQAGFTKLSLNDTRIAYFLAVNVTDLGRGNGVHRLIWGMYFDKNDPFVPRASILVYTNSAWYGLIYFNLQLAPWSHLNMNNTLTYLLTQLT